MEESPQDAVERSAPRVSWAEGSYPGVTSDVAARLQALRNSSEFGPVGLNYISASLFERLT